MKPSREIIKISMKAVVINIYISINEENGLLIIWYKILQCIFLKIIFNNISNLSFCFAYRISVIDTCRDNRYYGHLGQQE